MITYKNKLVKIFKAKTKMLKNIKKKKNYNKKKNKILMQKKKRQNSKICRVSLGGNDIT